MPTGVYTRGDTSVVRFLRKISKNEKKNLCWGWTGTKDKNGYGVLSLKKRNIKAHRFSYELHIGEIPKGMLVCHSCDNPPCTNPKHLWLGTAKDNTEDMRLKGRAARLHRYGTNSPNHKLTATHVLEIRKLTKHKTQREVARIFNVSFQTINLIVLGKSWKETI